MNYKVSVIVPVYNGEQYIRECCEQLVHQTLNDIEVILVNDGSEDRSALIINQCAEKYRNVVALHQQNKGVSAARNYGIKEATGEYIGFVDVDDRIEKDMFEMLYKFAVESNLDAVCMDKIGMEGEKTVFREREEWMSALFQADIKMSACNKLFSKSLLQENIFPEGKRIHEDLCAVYKVLSISRTVGAININKYHYIQREGTSSRDNIFSDKYFDAIEIANWIEEDAKKKFPELQDDIEARKAKTYLRISKIFYLRGNPEKYKNRIFEMKKYLKRLPKKKLKLYYSRNDIIRYYLYIYAMPLFLLLIKTIDNK